MQTKSDAQLLRDYAACGSEPAFAEIVARHSGLVYSAALRQTGCPDLAREVAQSVFIDLGRKAPAMVDKLAPDVSLAGWLYRATRYAVLNVLRHEHRREAQERRAMEHFNSPTETERDWELVAPVLDEAMDELGEADREALLLRYFQGQDFRAVGRALGVSDDAAQKRVSRALERLREFLSKRGVTVSANALALVIATNAVEAAPLGFTTAVSAGVFSGKLGLATTAAKVGRTIVMSTIHKTLITVGLLGFFGTMTYQAYRASKQPNKLVQAAAIADTTTQDDNGPRRFAPFKSVNNRSNPRTAPDLAKLAADLRSALYAVPSSRFGTRVYPPEEVIQALVSFGVNRKEAFPTLQQAASDPDTEVRKRAISAMWLVGASSTPKLATTNRHLAQLRLGVVGESAPEAKPFLWKVLSEEKDHYVVGMALSSLQNIGFDANEIPALTDLMSHTANEQLLRYLPEAITKTIETDPAGAAPFLPSLEALLTSSDSGLRFEAACALAKHEAARNPQILPVLVAGLMSQNNLQQLMALETLQRIGPVAEPALQAILDFGDATTDKVMKDVAFKAIGKIKTDLRSTLPEVEQALQREERIANWHAKLMSESHTYQDLLDGLKDPMLSAPAARKLGEMGASAQDSIPNLVAALSGQDQTKRQQIVEAIYKIDPTVEIKKVNSRVIANAAKMARLTLQAQDDGMRLALARAALARQPGDELRVAHS